eukprot:gnl/MRDRNA2_/MRDRNA2_62905_c0_seq1.p1 gnl/MRDRNA2_/MRDRNA2_62905_c0~~gnl/MRDRNA2_/MRDRNA2_62905_c0_seq1.p1  ORF type:complete len:553 (-),score=111.28 gnl/MRDRNA2_/MRDRNA2_62905_c0_seq1:195-1853(-)
MLKVLIVAAVLRCSTAQVSQDDLKRAKTKKPGNEYRGPDQTTMSKTLNGHLKRSEKSTRPCEHWSTMELQHFMATIGEHRSEELQSIYRKTSDRRDIKADSLEDHKAQWTKLNRITTNHPHLYAPLQDAHCREAVMWWVHHLSEAKKGWFRAQNVTVPLLPESEKKQCGQGEGSDEDQVCVHINEKNSCDWCHSTQAAHDAGVPGTAVPDALKKTTGPDDGNPKGWDIHRRCDQDQMPRCQLCQGIGGRAWSDKNEDIDLTPCEIVKNASDVDMSTVAPPLYPKTFTVKRKDGKQGGYSDTLIGWKTDPFCFGFFPQNDSIKPLCYRSEDSLVKYYDITKEAERIDYTVKNNGVFGDFGNITSTILMVQDTMWIMNHLWVVDQCICANPSGNHCETPPCKSYVHRWDTFKTAQYLGRENIGVEWIQNHGTGKSSKMMELDHFILWSHHVWTDPVSKRLVRAWKPFNGLQVYDPDAWVENVEDPSVFEAPPAKCKKGGAPVRINCDDDGNYHPKQSEGLEILDDLFMMAVSKGPAGMDEFVKKLYAAQPEILV